MGLSQRINKILMAVGTVGVLSSSGYILQSSRDLDKKLYEFRLSRSDLDYPKYFPDNKNKKLTELKEDVDRNDKYILYSAGVIIASLLFFSFGFSRYDSGKEV